MNTRRIKFRGKSGSGKWLYGSLVNVELLRPSIYFAVAESSKIDWAYVLEDSIGQFTGFLDKNGREIYEGDILRLTNPDEDGCHYTEVRREGVTLVADVVGCDYDYTAIDFAFDIWDNSGEEVEVIGNYEDNPDLAFAFKSHKDLTKFSVKTI